MTTGRFWLRQKKRQITLPFRCVSFLELAAKHLQWTEDKLIYNLGILHDSVFRIGLSLIRTPLA